VLSEKAMHFSQIAAFTLATASVAYSSPIVSRVQDSPDETVFIVNCDRFEGASKSPSGVRDQFLYFGDFDSSVSLINNPGTSHFFSSATARSVIGDKGQHDSKISHIDWTLAKEDSPLSAEFPQGTFQVWDLAEKGDTHTNITGVAKLDGRDFRCYGWPRFSIVDLQKGPNQVRHDCEARYYCTRSERLIRQTKFNVFDTTITVPIIGGSDMKVKDTRILDSIKGAFSQLEKAVAENAGDTHPYPINSSDFNLYFDIQRAEGPNDARYDPNRIRAITNYLTDKIAPKLYENQLIRNCRGTIIGLEPTCEHQIAWPAKILIQVQFATQALQNWDDQDIITIRVAKDPAKGDASCKKNKALAQVLGGLLSVGSVYTSGFKSAVAAGLGSIIGVPSNGNCMN
jgi:hypothetical protein